MKKVWKKLAAVLIAAMMAVGILPMSAVTVLADGESYVEITTTESSGVYNQTKTSTPINILMTYVGPNGASCGGWTETITISSDSGYVISKIEATVGDYSSQAPQLSVTSGTLEASSYASGAVIKINNVNANSTTLSAGEETARFSKFKVYYTHTHSGTLVSGKAATCTEDGWKDAYYCDGCATYFEDSACQTAIGDATAYDAWKTTGNGKLQGGHTIPQTWESDAAQHWKMCDRCHEVEISDTRNDHGNYKYELDDNNSKIIEKCGTCGYITGEITLTVPENAVYDGQEYLASWYNSHTQIKDKNITLKHEEYDGTNWVTIDKPIDAGKYRASITVEGVTLTKEFTIAKAKVAVPTAATGLVYNGEEQEGVIYSIDYSEDGVYAVSGTTKMDYAGNYKAIATLLKTDNYEWEDGTTESKTVNWSIAKKDITISWAGDSYTYDGYAHMPKASASDPNAEIVTDPSDGCIEVGEYTVTAYLAPGSSSEQNYNIAEGESCTFTITPAQYKVTAGADGELTMGAISDYTITGDGPYDEFVELTVDGKVVDQANYTAKSGSTIITLRKAYLETLSAGKHEVEMIWENGSTKTQFTIKKAEEDPTQPTTKDDSAKNKDGQNTTPKTGDSSNMFLWLLLLAASACAVTVMLLGRRRTR